METKTMSVTKQQMLLLRQNFQPGRVKLESKPELVRLLAELLVQQLKRERTEKERK